MIVTNHKNLYSLTIELYLLLYFLTYFETVHKIVLSAFTLQFIFKCIRCLQPITKTILIQFLFDLLQIVCAVCIMWRLLEISILYAFIISSIVLTNCSLNFFPFTFLEWVRRVHNIPEMFKNHNICQYYIINIKCIFMKINLQNQLLFFKNHQK